MKKVLIITYALFISIISIQNLSAGDPWIDNYGTSSTAGSWNTGIRSDTTSSLYPPYVKRWEKYEWRGAGINVVPGLNFSYYYNGYVYFGEGNGEDSTTWEDPGYVWAWDAATGVTKTGYPLGPLDSSIVSLGGLTIKENKLYATTIHQVYGWDISGATPVTLTGFPIDVTETTAANCMLEAGVTYWQDRLYFVSYGFTSTIAYLYVKDANNGDELWRKSIGTLNGGQTPSIWNGNVYVADRENELIHCWDATTGTQCSNFPVSITGVTRAMPVIEDGTMYIGTQSGYFYSIDCVSGNINWIYTHPSLVETVSTSSIWQDKIFFGSTGGASFLKMHGVYKNTGLPVPNFPVDSAGTAGPVSTANNIIYNGAGFGSAIDIDTGNIIWYGNPDLTHGGGVLYTFNYPSITIGDNEIIAVYASLNGIVCYEMPSPTISATVTQTHTNSPTYTITPTETHTNTVTVTLTPSLTSTQSATSIDTMTVTLTPTLTATHTPTSTFTRTATPTVTLTFTDTPTQSVTISVTATHTVTPTVTVTPATYTFRLIGNFPNPFTDSTNIVYELNANADVNICIFSISGERVRDLFQSGVEGKNAVIWDGRNNAIERVSAGVYIYRISAAINGEYAEKWGKCAVIR